MKRSLQNLKKKIFLHWNLHNDVWFKSPTPQYCVQYNKYVLNMFIPPHFSMHVNSLIVISFRIIFLYLSLMDLIQLCVIMSRLINIWPMFKNISADIISHYTLNVRLYYDEVFYKSHLKSSLENVQKTYLWSFLETIYIQPFTHDLRSTTSI